MRISNRATLKSPAVSKGGQTLDAGNGNGGTRRPTLGDATNPNIASVNPRPQHSVGGDSPVSTGTKGLSSFRFTFSNPDAAGTVGTYGIGCPLAESLSGISFRQPTAGSNVVQAMQESFAFAPIEADTIILRTSSDAAQLDQNFLYYPGVDINQSNKGTGAIDMNTTANPTFDSQLVRRLKFDADSDDAPALAWNTLWTIDVLGLETLTMTIIPAIAWNRHR